MILKSLGFQDPQILKIMWHESQEGLEIPMINKNHLKVALHGGGALVVEVALLCIASPSVL